MEGGVRLKYFCIVALFVIAGSFWGFGGVDGAGECGKLDPEVLAYKLAPCAAAAQDKNVAVPDKCCSLMKKVRTSCLCSVMLAKESKSIGIKPDLAVSIPQRCNIPRRPKAYKCGAYVVPG